VQVTGVSNIADIQLGDLFTCIRKMDGTVMCWGDNSYAQLGDGTLNPAMLPQTVPGLRDVTALDLGDSHACVLKSNTSMWCWGRNESNQQKQTGARINIPTEVISVARGHRQALAGGNSSGVVRQDGSMLSWGGQNHTWISGHPPTSTYSASIGGLATCAGSLWCGGHSGASRTGRPTYAVSGSYYSYTDCGWPELYYAGTSLRVTKDASGYWTIGGCNLSGTYTSSLFERRVYWPASAFITSFARTRDNYDTDVDVGFSCAKSSGAQLSSNSCNGVNIGYETFPPTGVYIQDSRYQQVSVGARHACSQTSSGIECWGEFLGSNRSPWAVP
jgi:hypothetical protein